MLSDPLPTYCIVCIKNLKFTRKPLSGYFLILILILSRTQQAWDWVRIMPQTFTQFHFPISNYNLESKFWGLHAIDISGP